MGKFFERTEKYLNQGINPISGGETDGRSDKEVIADSLLDWNNRLSFSKREIERLKGVLISRLELTNPKDLSHLVEILSGDYQRKLEEDGRQELAGLAARMGVNIIKPKEEK